MTDQERLDALQGVWPSEAAHVAILQYEIIRLREGLRNLYREHHDAEVECPNHVGECFCGMVMTNADIDFYLDPSRPREEYQAQRTRETVIERLDFLYKEYDGVMEIWEDDDDMLSWSLDNLNVMLNILLEAQPWLVKGGDNGPV